MFGTWFLSPLAAYRGFVGKNRWIAPAAFVVVTPRGVAQRAVDGDLVE
jgi:hypothetical protein